MDSEENFYGTTRDGGEAYNAGTVFTLTASGKERVLHRFRANYKVQHDGVYPETVVVRDGQGTGTGRRRQAAPAAAALCTK